VHAADLSIILDTEMLGRHGVVLAPPWTPDSALPKCADPETELGGRFLLKYIRKADRTRYSIFSSITHFPGVHYLTPTAICKEEVARILALPPFATPGYAVILDPAYLELYGPREIRGGSGIEYVALNGFSSSALVPPGWPIRIG
jgi:hypothetical protein